MMDSQEFATPRHPSKKKEYKKWSLTENLSYIQFLQKTISENNKIQRRPRSYFVNMSKHLGGLRTNEQCRSHHRKMLLTHSTIHRIIAHIKQREFIHTSSQSSDIPEDSSESLICEPPEHKVDKICELKQIPWENEQMKKDEFQCEEMLFPSIFY